MFGTRSGISWRRWFRPLMGECFRALEIHRVSLAAALGRLRITRRIRSVRMGAFLVARRRRGGVKGFGWYMSIYLEYRSITTSIPISSIPTPNPIHDSHDIPCIPTYCHDTHPSSLHTPLFPPSFRTILTSPIRWNRSTALHISTTLSAVPMTAVRASISTPVDPAHATVHSICTPPWPKLSCPALGILAPIPAASVPSDACESEEVEDEAGGSAPKVRNSTPTCVSAIGWHSGTISGHFFAAMMPAMRLTLSTSPFLRELEVMRDSGVGLEK